MRRKFLVPQKGRSSYGIAICDRCKFKYFLDELEKDRAAPGLMVCEKCNDEMDPYLLPIPPTEDITLTNPRPDEKIGIVEE